MYFVRQTTMFETLHRKENTIVDFYFLPLVKYLKSDCEI